MNPAYALAQNIWDAVDSKNNDAIQFIWIYTLCPLIGGIVGYLYYEYIWMIRIDFILNPNHSHGHARELPKAPINILPPVQHESKGVTGLTQTVNQEKPPQINVHEDYNPNSPEEMENLDNEEEANASSDD